LRSEEPRLFTPLDARVSFSPRHLSQFKSIGVVMLVWLAFNFQLAAEILSFKILDEFIYFLPQIYAGYKKQIPAMTHTLRRK
jgi:hypothetical protein